MARQQIRGNTQIMSDTITNTQIKSDAAIALSKLAATTASKALVSDGSGFVSASSVTATELGYVSGVTSAIQTQLGNKISTSEKGANSGVATLDAGGKIPASQLPNSVMEYQGTWAASTNTPTLANGTGNVGDVYVASDAGTVDFGAGNITFAAGDFAIYSGSVWQKSINSNAVASVNSQTGAVVLDADSLSDTSTTHKFVTAADITKLSNLSGTNTGDEPSATDTVQGVIELATQAEVNAGTDTVRAVTPATLASYTGFPTGPSFVDGEIPSGTINSINAAFTLAHTPNPASSLKVYVDGVRQRLTTDYTLVTNAITFTSAPDTGDNIYVDYRY